MFYILLYLTAKLLSVMFLLHCMLCNKSMLVSLAFSEVHTISSQLVSTPVAQAFAWYADVPVPLENKKGHCCGEKVSGPGGPGAC